MRILVLGSFHADTAASSIARVLSERHEVVDFPFDQLLAPFGWGRFRRLNIPYELALKLSGSRSELLAGHRLLNFVRAGHFDLVLVTIVKQVRAETLRDLKKRTGALIVGWAQDAITNLAEGELAAAPYDRVFFKDKAIVRRFRDGLCSDRFDFLPQAFDPELHRPISSSDVGPPDCDVATFGNSYPYRAALLADLLADRTISTIVYGATSAHGDPALSRVRRPPVFAHDKSRAMLRTRIAINTNHYAELEGVNKRTFELCGIGACQLTDGPAIAEYFLPEREVFVFRGPRDLVEKVKWLLAHPEDRVKVAAAGLVRAWRDHTYHQRLNEMFDRIPALRGESRVTVPAQQRMGGAGPEGD